MGLPHLQQTSLMGGHWGGDPQENTAPFIEPGPAKSRRVGTEGQDRPGHNQRSVLAAPSPQARTCTNTQSYANPKHTPSSHPHTCTHMQIGTYTVPGTPSPVPSFRETPPLFLPLPLSSRPLRHPAPATHQRRLGATQVAHTINSAHLHSGADSQTRREPQGQIPRGRRRRVWEGAPILRNADTEARTGPLLLAQRATHTAAEGLNWRLMNPWCC